MSNLKFRTPNDSFGNYGSNPFDVAYGYSSQVGNVVVNELNNSRKSADNAITTADYVIGQLVNFQMQDLPVPFSPPVLDFSFDSEFDLPPVSVSDFGSLPAYVDPTAPSVSEIPNITVPNIPTFTKSIDNITIPSSPSISYPNDPGVGPTAPILVFPDKPEWDDPVLPELATITIPEQDFSDLPTFDPTYPEFLEREVDTTIQWSEPVYTEKIIDDVISQIEIFLAGGTGLREEIEQALFDRASGREDQITRQAIDEVTEEYASRGYTMPPGYMIRRVDAIRAERDLKKQGLSREVYIKAMDVEIENLRFAVEQGIAAEGFYLQLFLAATERAFEVAKLSVEWQMRLYELSVEIYRVKMERIKIEADVFTAQIQAWIAEVSAYEALVRAEEAKARVNQTLVEAYKAEIDAVTARIQAYTAEIEAVEVRAKVFESEIRAYLGSVQAYSARVEAERNKVMVFESQVRGELAKVEVVKAEAQAYTAQIQGITAGVTAEATAVNAVVSKINAETDVYRAKITNQTAKIQGDLAVIQANVAGYQADTSRYIAKANAEEASSRVELAAWETGLRTQIEYYRTELARWTAELEAITKSAEINLRALEAAGSLTSTIAAGALSAMNIGANIQGAGRVDASGSLRDSFSWDKSCQTQQAVSYQFNGELEGSNPPGGAPWNCPF